jgi:hypothetical protein
MFYEGITGHNLFSAVGIVPEFSTLREGRVRCQGSFAHPILAGTFGATVMPLILILWWYKGYKKVWCIIGLIGASVITFFASSSGAFMTFILELIAFNLWYIKERMHWVRRGLVVGIIGLVIVMKAPIWYVFSKLSDTMGGTGWHRAYLLDQAFGKYFHEWWLLGAKYTRHWMPTGVFYSEEQTDITNQFLWEGVNGGLFTMALFIAIIVCCFKTIGWVLRYNVSSNCFLGKVVWTFGVVLFGHIMSFMSISYFDQIIVYWEMTIGTIAAISTFPRLEDDNDSIMEMVCVNQNTY